MQLHLETDELNLIANILMERIGKASAQAGRFSSRPDENVRTGPQFYDRLLDKILARDLRLDTDELDQMSEVLDMQRCKLTEQIARGGNAALQAELQRKLRLLDHILERISETCVMF
jgi:hypothetical protein